nr:excalibur calcium-binding domain-containing protein [uncultured Enterobacter sp.]
MKFTLKPIAFALVFFSASSYSYECNGRQYCSQVNSCAEAKWVLNNCPNPKMDGDHDGIPCEQQHCGHGALSSNSSVKPFFQTVNKSDEYNSPD